VTRLDRTWAQLRMRKRKALIAFVTAGDPSLAATVPALHALVRGGVDVLELGVPFSDPEGEGPSIQASSERALKAGTRLSDVIDLVAQFRADDRETPILLMGYLNPVERMGVDAYAARLAEVGADGTIVVNLPPEESAPLGSALAARGLSLVLLAAPTTTEVRMKKIADAASGFIYYVSLKGVTGAKHLDPSSIAARVAALRAVSDLPVAVGFGIRDGATAARVAAACDGVAIGSVFVDTMQRLAADPDAIPAALEKQAAELRSALG
jgi:tryptophan synthase alpha chain